jgi:anti-sigma factor RsiW
MSAQDTPDLDRVQALMMAALDGEISPEERRELDALLARQPDIAAEWARLGRLKEVMTTMGVRIPPEEVWDRFRVTTMHRVERTAGWLLVLFGAAVLGGTALWLWLEAFLASDVPILVKAAVVSLGVGALILLISVIRERWILYRRDPYSREIVR